MSNASILIVEDEAIVAADLAGKLGRLGYGISGTTGFGEDAVNHARENRPDLILMDIRLAGAMDGVEAAEIIRRELDLPVIFLTAHSDSATLERAKLAGPFGYILKPFEERELATNIEMALVMHQAERRLRQANDELEVRVEERTKALKEAERELREMNATLEQRVAQRTTELETANGLLRDSRLAALNMMEDAVVARRQAEEATAALQKSELFYRQILESIPGMVFTTRPDGFCDFQSQQWVDFTGVPMVEHLGDGWNRLLHPDDRPRAFAAWNNAVAEVAPYDLEYRVRRHDGEYEWFKVRGRPIRNEVGEIVRWFGTAVNIDDLVRTQEELRQATVAAEAATVAKSEFLANMSHEIRTPMTVFMSVLEHLLQIDDNTEHRQLLEMADDSAKRLRALIDDILDFSRIEARRVELKEEPFDLRCCVHEAVEMFALSAREKQLRLETTVAAETPSIVVGDRNRLGQVLTNLVGNAVKFTPAGEVRVTVQSRADLLEFSIADTGIGIPEEKYPLLFQSFTQVDSSFHRQYGGSGLGLSICRGLVEVMGGRIAVRNREGGGCDFTFTLPLKTAASQELAPPAPLSEVPVMNSPTVRILLADDEPMIRQVIILMLTRRGWHVETAVSGREAVEKWESGNFDILLMDLQMPEMNGLEAARVIRSREVAGDRRACIIALTAHARKEIIEECLREGMDQVLFKPVQMNDLYAVIESCLPGGNPQAKIP